MYKQHEPIPTRNQCGKFGVLVVSQTSEASAKIISFPWME